MVTPDPLPRRRDGVVLRRLTVADLAAFQAYRHDPLTGRFQGWSPVPDEEAAAFLAEMSAAALLQPGEWSQIGIATSEADRLIGDIGLFMSLDGAYVEIGFTLDRHWQGRGLATVAVREAIDLVFEWTAAARVIAVTDARNTASIRLLERVGLHWIESAEAIFRGEACIEHFYARARPGDG